MNEKQPKSPWPDEIGRLVNALRLCEPADLQRAVRWLRDVVDRIDRDQRVEYAIALAWQEPDAQYLAQETREACERVASVLGAVEQVLVGLGPKEALGELVTRLQK